MRVLALDTATESCSAALLLDGKLWQRAQRLERGHAQAILPMLDELLTEAGTPLSSLNAIAFGRGPGAFTGVRLAASVTQGLAFGAGLPVVPVSDLRALAQRVLDEDPAIGRVLVCADARMQEVYWGSYERSDQGFAAARGEEYVGRPGDVRVPEPWRAGSAPQAARAADRLVGVGSGFANYPELGRRADLPLEVVGKGWLPRAAEIARLAAPEVSAGRFLPAEQALPLYLRDDVVRAVPGPS